MVQITLFGCYFFVKERCFLDCFTFFTDIYWVAYILFFRTQIKRINEKEVIKWGI